MSALRAAVSSERSTRIVVRAGSRIDARWSTFPPMTRISAYIWVGVMTTEPGGMALPSPLIGSLGWGSWGAPFWSVRVGAGSCGGDDESAAVSDCDPIASAVRRDEDEALGGVGDLHVTGSDHHLIGLGLSLIHISEPTRLGMNS